MCICEADLQLWILLSCHSSDNFCWGSLPGFLCITRLSPGLTTFIILQFFYTQTVIYCKGNELWISLNVQKERKLKPYYKNVTGNVQMCPCLITCLVVCYWSIWQQPFSNYNRLQGGAKWPEETFVSKRISSSSSSSSSHIQPPSLGSITIATL